MRAGEREKILRGQEGEAAARVFRASDARDGKLERGHVGEELAAILAQVAIFGVGKLPVIAAGVLPRGEKVDHLGGTQRNHGAQDRAVDDGKDGGVHANGERERENGDGGEAWRLGELPERETEILDHGFPLRCDEPRGWIQECDAWVAWDLWASCAQNVLPRRALRC